MSPVYLLKVFFFFFLRTNRYVRINIQASVFQLYQFGSVLMWLLVWFCLLRLVWKLSIGFWCGLNQQIETSLVPIGLWNDSFAVWQVFFFGNRYVILAWIQKLNNNEIHLLIMEIIDNPDSTTVSQYINMWFSMINQKDKRSSHRGVLLRLI